MPLDVTTWPLVEDARHVVVQDEPRGRREKAWVTDAAGGLWLRKRHRDSRPNEPAIEVLALELARRAGLEAASATTATWRDETGTEVRGVLVKKFHEPAEHLSQGFEVLRGADSSYSPEDHWAHTLTRVKGALLALEQGNEERLWPRFTQHLVFDAWLGNGDRHPGNWGVIRSRGRVRLAPFYDPPACLGAELQPEGVQALLDRPNKRLKYIKRCRSGFGSAGGPALQVDLIAELLRDDDAAPYAREAVRGERLRQWLGAARSLVAQIPDPWLPSANKELVLLLLEERAQWLTQEVERAAH